MGCKLRENRWLGGIKDERPKTKDESGWVRGVVEFGGQVKLRGGVEVALDVAQQVAHA
jgi:hypothetical protein